MEEIVPRWEWRTFGNDLTRGEEAIREYPRTRAKESTEQYILSSAGNDNTKVRDELLDIKTLLRVNDDGLEQWTVLLKTGFPIHINKLALVYKAFDITFPYLDKDQYTSGEFINDLVGANDKLTIVEVGKKRLGYMINDCIVEIAEVAFNGKPFKTIAVEHTDPSLVIATVDKLGLRGYENINYINAMKAAEGIHE